MVLEHGREHEGSRSPKGPILIIASFGFSISGRDISDQMILKNPCSVSQ
jgi:hypothetical protein